MRLSFLCASATATVLALGMTALATAPAAAAAPASQNVTQSNPSGTVTDNGDPVAYVIGNAFSNATGNIGVNVAAGVGNQQANALYLDTGSPPYAVSSSLSQTNSFNGIGTGLLNNAYATGNAFRNASGNIGANLSAGVVNEQINAAMIMDANDIANAALSAHQASSHNSYTSFNDDNAYFEGNAFQNATGNIGANAAGGLGNQQINQLVAATKSGSSAPSFVTQGMSQSSLGDTVRSTDRFGFNDVANNAFQNASGNIGVNAAGGNANQQANSLFVDNSLSAGFPFTGTYSQYVSGAAITDNNNTVTNTAFIGDNAFQHASGNMGVNIASGNVNEQLNGATIVSGADLSSSVSTITQTLGTWSIGGTGNDTAFIDNNAFQYASGNIGVNVSSGDLNQQANTLLIVH